MKKEKRSIKELIEFAVSGDGKQILKVFKRSKLND